MASNLPPGCSISDIPGNRPEDMDAEAEADAQVDYIEATPICADTIRSALDLVEEHDLWWLLYRMQERGQEIERAETTLIPRPVWSRTRPTEPGTFLVRDRGALGLASISRDESMRLVVSIDGRYWSIAEGWLSRLDWCPIAPPAEPVSEEEIHVRQARRRARSL